MEEEIDLFVSEFAKTQLPKLSNVEKYAKENYIPICSKPLANFLSFFVSFQKPKRILEIGTAIGYSSIIMASGCKTTHIDTLELDGDRLQIAEKNMAKFGVQDQITTFHGDAGDMILNFEADTYDLIFLDGPKTQYFSYLASIKSLLKNGGVLVADNIFQRGMTTGQTELNPKHRATIVKMKKFVNCVAKDKDFCSTILPIGDGVLLATKK